MASVTKCVLTGFYAEDWGSDGDSVHLNCPALGGPYEVTGTALEILKNVAPAERRKLATLVLDEHHLGNERPRISSQTIESVKQRRPLAVMQKVHRLYELVATRSAAIGTRHPIGGAVTPELTAFLEAACAWTESASTSELRPLWQYAIAQGHFAERTGSTTSLELTVLGWSYVENLRLAGRVSSQGFVAMWFGLAVADAYENGVVPAFADAGFSPMRIDRKEHSNRIDDEIIAEIRRSRFLVADFTCEIVMRGEEEIAVSRGGVYYEAGFAQGLGIPVIWMCREDHIAHVHFDTRQFNHITWKDPGDLRVKLRNRIGAVIGDGPGV